MKQFSKFLTLIVCILFLFSTVRAVPAYPGIIQKVQSDGTTLEFYLFGDEFLNWSQTLDDYTIMCNESGDHVYMYLDESGDLVYSDIIAHSEKDRTEAERLFLSTIKTKLFFSEEQLFLVNQIKEIKNSRANTVFPCTGNQTLLCVLMQYPDQMMIKTKQNFIDLFNMIGYNEGGVPGSFKDFYLESSYGNFNITVDVVGPYTASGNINTYGYPGTGAQRPYWSIFQPGIFRPFTLIESGTASVVHG